MSLLTKENNNYSKFIDSLNKQEQEKFAFLKRLLELYNGSEQMRSFLHMGIPIETIDKNFTNSNVHFQDILEIMDPSRMENKSEMDRDFSLSHLWVEYLRSAKKFRDQLLDCGYTQGVSKNFDIWRRRNIERTSFELGIKSTGIMHAPIAFELSDGCSVGCWFCGVSAQKFNGHFSLDVEGKKEWKETLESTYSVLGKGMATGFCYWATDPLDNPDYIEFLEIYNDVVGVVPQTTTAIPLKDINLTKKVLELWRINKDYPVRFSILNNSILKKVHEAFSPLEMIGVELVLQNNGQINNVKSKSGKALATDKPKKVQQLSSDAPIACVSGFLINIVTKKVKLISPTIPSDKWKEGYIIFDEDTYNSPEELRILMNRMIKKNMPQALNPNDLFKKVDHISLSFDEKIDNKLYLESPNVKVDYSNYKNIIPEILKAKYTPIDLICSLTKKGEDPIKAVYLLESLWSMGLIDNV